MQKKNTVKEYNSNYYEYIEYDRWWLDYGTDLGLKKLQDAKRLDLLSESFLLQMFINPFTPVFLCDHHYQPTVFKGLPSTVKLKLNLLNENSIQFIDDHDIVCCESDSFEMFVEKIIPNLKKKVFLFTYRWYLPQVSKSRHSEIVLNHPNILHWFSQNPIYPSSRKYSGFPYGINEGSLLDYTNIFLNYNGSKYVNFLHLPVSNTNINRKSFKPLPLLPIKEFYEKMSFSKFVLSPEGDRPDTYRHYECIGLETVPISNINQSLYSFFGNSMSFMKTEDMEKYDGNQLIYNKPKRFLVYSDYWISKVLSIKKGMSLISNSAD